MNIEDILKEKKSSELFTVDKDMHAVEAVKELDEKMIGALIVTDKNDKIVGIVTEKDFLFKTYKMAGTKKPLELKVSDLMTRAENMHVVMKSEKPIDVMALMIKQKIRHVPVKDENTIIGMLSTGDILNFLFKSFEEEASNLREHIKNPMGVHFYGKVE